MSGADATSGSNRNMILMSHDVSQIVAGLCKMIADLEVPFESSRGNGRNDGRPSFPERVLGVNALVWCVAREQMLNIDNEADGKLRYAH